MYIMAAQSGYFRIAIAVLALPLIFTGLAEAQRCSLLVPVFLPVDTLPPGAPDLAATPAPDILRECRLMAQSFLCEKLWLWQKRLSLTSWNIRLELIRSSGLRPKTLGNIHWGTDTRTAEIHVLAPEDYKLSTRDMLADMEFTLVHELVHLRLSSLPRSENSRDAEERTVNQITQALLDLDRR
jgi:hypothetical protein